MPQVVRPSGPGGFIHHQVNAMPQGVQPPAAAQQGYPGSQPARSQPVNDTAQAASTNPTRPLTPPQPANEGQPVAHGRGAQSPAHGHRSLAEPQGGAELTRPLASHLESRGAENDTSGQAQSQPPSDPPSLAHWAEAGTLKPPPAINPGFTLQAAFGQSEGY